MESRGQFLCVFTSKPTEGLRFCQAIEGAAAACLAFISGELGVTLSNWPVAAIPAGIFFGNTALVSIIVYAAASTTGAHINPNVTISAFFCGLCHPVRAAVYLFCQIVGGIIGGAFLRAGLGEARALALHNGGCWLDPAGITTVGQASALEFMSTFCLL
jgi:glycerol uptake facilitator-like aquaporin